MRSLLTYIVLLACKAASRVFYRFDLEWIGRRWEDPWRDIRVIAILHHTSLYEPVFAGVAPNRLLRRIAGHGVIPVADKTMERLTSGLLFRLVGAKVVPVSRKRDETWERVLAHYRDPRAITVILPEGRMMRRTGLDSEGNPMTLRGGIADLLKGVDGGRMLLVYSGGLHQIAAPGERYPRVFQRVALRLEAVDIPEYREALGDDGDPARFKRRVVEDLTGRRNAHCPLNGPTLPSWAA